MRLVEVTAAAPRPCAFRQVPRSSPLVASRGTDSRDCVSGQQRSPAGTPLPAAEQLVAAPIGARKALWHKDSRQAGPQFAYARHAAPQVGKPRCRRNVCWHTKPKKTGEVFTMPAVRQPAMLHRNAAYAAAARGRSSAPFRYIARAGHAQHAARCTHASAERRLQARSPQGACGGPGRWPFHACAICAPPSHRFLRH